MANEILDSNGLERMILDHRIDPHGCRTTNIKTNLALFGINETNAILYDDMLYNSINGSSTKEMLMRHYKIIADNTCSSGNLIFATSSSLSNDADLDIMRKIAFETANDFIEDEIKNPEEHPAYDQVSASMFGNSFKIGSGYSKVILYPVGKTMINQETIKIDDSD
jgi:hypothetical protein